MTWKSANRELVNALIFAQIMAVVWWLAALGLPSFGVLVWTDQIHIFRAAVESFNDPYTVTGFVNVPWLVIVIAPFRLLPVEIAVLCQAGLMFALLTIIIFRFGGDFRSVVLTLTSFMSLDAILQMNIEWVVMVGLLLPVHYSLPFLLVKPQLALGYYFAVPPKKWFICGVVAVGVVLISFVIWGNWVPDMIVGIQTNSLGRFFNIAPINLLPWPISVAIGGFFAYKSFRKQDAALGILAGFFFVPYFAPYSLPLIFAIVAIKARRLAIIISISMWVIYGGAILIGILQQ